MIKIVTYYYDNYRNYNCKCYKSHNLEPNWQTAYHTKEIKMSQWQFVDKKNNDYISKNKILENKSSMNLLYV